jgi:hypothetical protein
MKLFFAPFTLQLCQYSDSITQNGTMNNELERIWKEDVMT